MWRSDFTATHYRSRAGCLEHPRFDRNLTAIGCLSLSLPVPLCLPMSLKENDYESEGRRFESCRARQRNTCKLWENEM